MARAYSTDTRGRVAATARSGHCCQKNAELFGANGSVAIKPQVTHHFCGSTQGNKLLVRCCNQGFDHAGRLLRRNRRKAHGPRHAR